MNVKKVTKEILKALNDRKGFDDWWDGIEEDIQEEITSEIIEIIERASEK